MSVKILVIEDEYVLAVGLKEELKQFGYNVVSIIDSGEEAIQQIQELSPDIIILDIMLSGEIDGIDSAQKIQSNYDIPIIYLTAYANDDILERAKNTKPFGYLVKPVKREELHATIEMALYKHREDKKIRELNDLLQKELSERKQAEERLNRFFNISSNLICIVGINDGHFKYTNPAWKTILGYSREELQEKPYHQFLFPEDHTKSAKEVEKLASNQPTINFENRYIHKDGSVKTILWTAAPIITEALIYCIGQDITERKLFEERIHQSQKIETIGTLAGGIAHNFNNILSVIMGNISYVLNELKNDDDLTDALMDAQEGIKRGVSLTKQLITFSRGGAPIKKTITLYSQMKDTVKLVLSGSSSKCNFNISDNELWPVEADEGQLNHAFGNLIINADQAMPEGGIIQISIENEYVDKCKKFPLAIGPYVCIKINDQGIGIPKKYLSKVFDPFFTTKQKGNGLGLSTAFSIIKRHDGHIEVESTPGEGTTFTIYLPVTEKVLSQPESQDEIDHKSRGKILVMDDQEDMLKMTRRMLGGMGYETVLAKDGAQAIEIYREAFQSSYPFDLVILDLTVPGGMGGQKTIKELLQINPNVQAVVSSGYSNDPVMSDYQDYGFIGVAPKPYSTEEMASLLNKILDEND